MANKKITELTEAASAGVDDVLAVVDIATPETKKIKVSNLKTSLNIQKSDVGLGNVDNTSDSSKVASGPIKGALDLKVNKAGDTMTGSLIVNPSTGYAIEAENLKIGKKSTGISSISTKSEVTDELLIQSGDQLNTFAGNNSRLVGLLSGVTNGANSGQVVVQSGDVTDGNSGVVQVQSGVVTGSGNSGQLILQSSSAPNSSGIVSLRSGDCDGAGVNSGNVIIQTGVSSTFNSGDIILETGAAAGTKGQITLDAVAVFSYCPIGMNNNKIGGLANGTSASDAVNKSQLDTKQATITGAATTIVSSDLTASRALASDASGKVTVSAVTSAELGYLSGVTSAIQTQLGAKANLASPALTGTPTAPTASASTNTTQIATTAFVQTAVAPATPVQISALNIDWSLGEIFYRDISVSSTFTFSNLVEGKGISVIITNTSGLTVTATFPSGIFKEAGALQIAASSAAVYTFIRANGKTYLSSVTGLTNA